MKGQILLVHVSLSLPSKAEKTADKKQAELARVEGTHT